MDQFADSRPAPPALPLVFASVGIMGIGLFAWGVLALLTTWSHPLRPGGVAEWLLPLATLPGVATGSLATYTTRRWWPFFVGIAITLVPVFLAVLSFDIPAAEAGGGD